MSASTQTQPVLDTVGRWSLSSRIAFRFCFVYLGLFCVTTQILGALFPWPNFDFPDPSTFRVVQWPVFWTAAHIFQIKLPLVYTDSGSGDKTFDWILVFCILVVAACGALVWSIADRRRENYETLYKWFRVFLRFALASQMFSYGMAKAVPLQMPFPFLTRLLEPAGNFSPMGVLWFSIGASPAYEIFAGCAELLGGILLIIPRTTMLGSLICLADMVQVFVLNMTYDVPVKLFSFHLILMAVFLLAPDFKRLGAFFLHADARPSTEAALFRGARANRIALAVQVIFGAAMIGLNIYGSWTAWHTYGGGRPKSPLYGIWDVNQMSVDGQIRPPLLTDHDRWRRAIFDFPNRMTFQRLDDSFAGYGASINARNNTMALSKENDKQWKSNFRFQRVAQDQLILDGEMDSHKVHMQLQLASRDKWMLVSRGFHWIQEYPFNR